MLSARYFVRAREIQTKRDGEIRRLAFYLCRSMYSLKVVEPLISILVYFFYRVKIIILHQNQVLITRMVAVGWIKESHPRTEDGKH